MTYGTVTYGGVEYAGRQGSNVVPPAPPDLFPKYLIQGPELSDYWQIRDIPEVGNA